MAPVLLVLFALVLSGDLCSAGSPRAAGRCFEIGVAVAIVLVPLLAVLGTVAIVMSENRDRRWRLLLELAAPRGVLETMDRNDQPSGWALIVDEAGQRRAVVRGSPASVAWLRVPGRDERVDLPLERWDRKWRPTAGSDAPHG